jgi:HlyD family secretion protein
MSKARSTSGLIISLTLIAAVSIGSWFYFRSSGEKAPEFSSTKVARGDVQQVVTATGGLEAVTSVDVSSQISGLIIEINVDYNTPVKKGQVLAKLDPATYESRLSSAKAQLANTTANFNLIRLNTERTRGLRTQNLVSQAELDQAEAQLAQSQAQMLIQQAAVDTAKVDLARCTIYSPIDGIVIDRIALVGKTVSASTSAPTLFTIANDLSQMQISAAVAEADIGNIEDKQNVNFTVDAYPSRQFRGRISQIRNAPKTQSNVVTYETIIDVRNDDLKLKPGMTANVSIIIAQRTGTLKVSNSALRVRIPENLLPPPAPVAAATKAGDGKTPPAKSEKSETPKPLTDEQRRTAMREIMREVGFSFGAGGPPSADIIAKMEALAKERGLDLDFSRMSGGRGGGGGNRGGNTPASNAPVTRTLYKLVGSDPKTQKLEPVQVKLGISDGIATEIIDGMAEGDLLITSVSIPGVTPAAAPQAGAPSALTGGNRGFGGGGSPGGGRGR